MAQNNDKPMDQWTWQEVVANINASNLPNKTKQEAINEVKEEEVKGTDLMSFQSVDDLMANLSFTKPLRARKFYEWIQEKRPPVSVEDAMAGLPSDDEEDDNGNNFSDDEGDDIDDNKNDGNFTITWVFGSKTSISNNNYTIDSTLNDAVNQLKENESWPINSGTYLIIDSCQVGSDKFHKTFAALGVQAPLRGTLNIQIGSKMVGGSKMLKKKEKKRRQYTKTMLKKYPILKKMMTFDRDVISQEDDKTLRAKMPCGHSVSPNSMNNWIDSSIRYNQKITKFYCPVPKCKKEWDFELCSIVACMKEKEYQKYKNILNRRSHPELKKCPTCKVPVKRPNDLRMLRVNCGNSCPDFCFSCLKTWKKGGFIVCSNDGCATANLNKILRECKEIVIRQSDGKNYGNKETDKLPKIPELRSCVYCTQLIKYDHQCKHMTCQACKKSFCFSCLRKYSTENGWPCGGYADQCPGGIADRQVLN